MLDTKYLGAIMKTFKNTKFENIIVVGRGRVALRIYEIVKNDFENAILYSGKEGDDHFNSLKNCFIISANNLYVFKPLCVENNTIINYHNALLPRHRGLNAAMWAIYNGDKYTGVCWHLVESGIDTGDILACDRIKITDKIDSLELIYKQGDLAINLFKKLFDDIKNDNVKPIKQKNKGASYHNKELPNKAKLNLSWKFEKISCFLRAFACCLTTKPKIKLAGDWQEVTDYTISSNSIVIKSKNSSITIKRNNNGR